MLNILHVFKRYHQHLQLDYVLIYYYQKGPITDISYLNNKLTMLKYTKLVSVPI
jgi:hypothetical protein